MNTQYLESIKKQFHQYKKLGEKAMEQLSPDQLFFVPNENSNSIAIIIKHLSGNMLSRWTDFLDSDGEKPWRDRDSEFENNIPGKEQLFDKWNEGWTCLFTALETIKPDELLRTVYIRNEAHTVMEAINRQLTHYAYHVGQIVFAAKLLKEGEWASMTIPKNKSKEFNLEKFSEKKN